MYEPKVPPPSWPQAVRRENLEPICQSDVKSAWHLGRLSYWLESLAALGMGAVCEVGSRSGKISTDWLTGVMRELQVRLWICPGAFREIVRPRAPGEVLGRGVLSSFSYSQSSQPRLQVAVSSNLNTYTDFRVSSGEVRNSVSGFDSYSAFLVQPQHLWSHSRLIR